MPKNNATWSAKLCQIEAIKIVTLTTNHRIECSIFSCRFRIKFKTKRKRDKLKTIIIICALSGIFSICKFLVAKKNCING